MIDYANMKYEYILDYAVYENGDVYSLRSDRFLKHQITRFGYKEVTLCSHCKVFRVRVHQLVAFLFIPNPENLPIINHIDGNKLNNHYTNLEWCTYYHNNKHARVTGLNNVSKSNSDRWNDPEFRSRTSKNISEGIIKSGAQAGENNSRFRYRVFYGTKVITRKDLAKLLNRSQSNTDLLIYRATHNDTPQIFIENNINIIDTKSQG